MHRVDIVSNTNNLPFENRLIVEDDKYISTYVGFNLPQDKVDKVNKEDLAQYKVSDETDTADYNIMGHRFWLSSISVK